MFNDETPQIYVACLAAFNNGYTHGKWILANQGAETIYQEIQKMLSESPINDAEEWIIQYCKHFFGLLCISESTEIDEVCELADFITEHGVELMTNFHNLDDAKELLENNYHGECSHELDFAIKLFYDIYLDSIPDHLTPYIDYEAFKYDIFINDYFSLKVNGNVHIFSHL